MSTLRLTLASSATLKGYYVPPLRVAAVKDKGIGIVGDLKTDEDWTLIDGLQRTTCYIIAVLMVALGDELVEEDCLDEQIWEEIFAMRPALRHYRDRTDGPSHLADSAKVQPVRE